MDIGNNPLLADLVKMQAEIAPLPQAAATAAPGSDFGQLFADAINRVNALQGESRDMATRFDSGDHSVSISDVMIASQKSGIAFDATVQVRNKVVEAYKTIMNMAI